MAKTYHMQMDIRGFLLDSMSDHKFEGVLQDDSGRPMTAREAKNAILDELAKGHRFIRVGEGCADFDPMTGCTGHQE